MLHHVRDVNKLMAYFVFIEICANNPSVPSQVLNSCCWIFFVISYDIYSHLLVFSRLYFLSTIMTFIVCSLTSLFNLGRFPLLHSVTYLLVSSAYSCTWMLFFLPLFFFSLWGTKLNSSGAIRSLSEKNSSCAHFPQ